MAPLCSKTSIKRQLFQIWRHPWHILEIPYYVPAPRLGITAIDKKQETTRPVLDRFHDSSKVNALICFISLCFMLCALCTFWGGCMKEGGGVCVCKSYSMDSLLLSKTRNQTDLWKSCFAKKVIKFVTKGFYISHNKYFLSWLGLHLQLEKSCQNGFSFPLNLGKFIKVNFWTCKKVINSETRL